MSDSFDLSTLVGRDEHIARYGKGAISSYGKSSYPVPQSYGSYPSQTLSNSQTNANMWSENAATLVGKSFDKTLEFQQWALNSDHEKKLLQLKYNKFKSAVTEQAGKFKARLFESEATVEKLTGAIDESNSKNAKLIAEIEALKKANSDLKNSLDNLCNFGAGCNKVGCAKTHPKDHDLKKNLEKKKNPAPSSKPSLLSSPDPSSKPSLLSSPDPSSKPSLLSSPAPTSSSASTKFSFSSHVPWESSPTLSPIVPKDKEDKEEKVTAEAVADAGDIFG